MTPTASPACPAAVPGDIILQADGLSLGYGSRTVIHDISFSVREGEYACLIGRNGSGKSTLFKGVLGLLPPLSGSVRIRGGNAATAFLPQSRDGDCDFPATVWEVALSGRRPSGPGGFFYSRRDKSTAAGILELLDIADLRHRQIATLSGGQRQRAHLARCLCRHPDILLLDEPYTGLDYQAAQGLTGLLARLQKEHGIAILMSTHDLAAVAANASRVLVLDGTLIFDGGVHQWLNTIHNPNYAGEAPACTR